MPVKLHDLVTEKGKGIFFSPFCYPVRLSLHAKGIEFDTEEVQYQDLRFVWTPKLGVDKATAPFIEREDGSHLMGSLDIALWLDKTFPSHPNLFLPEADLPVEVDSAEYRQAVESFRALDDAAFQPLATAISNLYAPRITKALDAESSKYWIDKHNYKEGEWERLTSATEEDDAKVVAQIQNQLRQLTEERLKDGRLFFAFATKPGYHDFALAGWTRLLRSLSPTLYRETFRSEKSGTIAGWSERMDEVVPTPEVWCRDPKE
ncbi:hypothetical protein JCM10908_001270 [Rhodotorula pacifica]|uniref:uncharacterized protein n=1 Tax=Rhodotorula pacifica TaxID=1495444 RepID=UPI00317A4132